MDHARHPQLTLDDLRETAERLFDPEPNSGCWLWFGAGNGWGYGSLGRGGKAYAAHRLMYEALVGPIPPGLQIDHLCRVRSCVNPTHMEPVTQRVNLLRGQTVVARQAAQTHCVHGHAFTEDNTWVSKKGKRGCRACNRRKADHIRLRRRTASALLVAV